MSALTSGQCLGTGRVTLTTTKREEVDGGFIRVPTGIAEGSAELWIDVGAILKVLGTKALKSKGRKAQAMRGALVVKVCNVTERKL